MPGLEVFAIWVGLLLAPLLIPVMAIIGILQGLGVIPIPNLGSVSAPN